MPADFKEEINMRGFSFNRGTNQYFMAKLMARPVDTVFNHAANDTRVRQGKGRLRPQAAQKKKGGWCLGWVLLFFFGVGWGEGVL